MMAWCPNRNSTASWRRRHSHDKILFEHFNSGVIRSFEFGPSKGTIFSTVFSWIQTSLRLYPRGGGYFPLSPSKSNFPVKLVNLKHKYRGCLISPDYFIEAYSWTIMHSSVITPNYRKWMPREVGEKLDLFTKMLSCRLHEFPGCLVRKVTRTFGIWALRWVGPSPWRIYSKTWKPRMTRQWKTANIFRLGYYGHLQETVKTQIKHPRIRSEGWIFCLVKW